MSISNLPDGMKQRESHLYAIAGWFSQPSRIDGRTAFGGYFRHDVKDKLVLNGQLVDLWGQSEIEGTMDEQIFRFTKVYGNRKDLINYSFIKQNGIWVGQYDGIATGTGPAECRTFIANDICFDIRCGRPVPPIALGRRRD